MKQIRSRRKKTEIVKVLDKKDADDNGIQKVIGAKTVETSCVKEETRDESSSHIKENQVSGDGNHRESNEDFTEGSTCEEQTDKDSEFTTSNNKKIVSGNKQEEVEEQQGQEAVTKVEENKVSTHNGTKDADDRKPKPEKPEKRKKSKSEKRRVFRKRRVKKKKVKKVVEVSTNGKTESNLSEANPSEVVDKKKKKKEKKKKNNDEDSVWSDHYSLASNFSQFSRVSQISKYFRLKKEKEKQSYYNYESKLGKVMNSFCSLSSDEADGFLLDGKKHTEIVPPYGSDDHFDFEDGDEAGRCGEGGLTISSFDLPVVIGTGINHDTSKGEAVSMLPNEKSQEVDQNEKEINQGEVTSNEAADKEKLAKEKKFNQEEISEKEDESTSNVESCMKEEVQMSQNSTENSSMIPSRGKDLVELETTTSAKIIQSKFSKKFHLLKTNEKNKPDVPLLDNFSRKEENTDAADKEKKVSTEDCTVSSVNPKLQKESEEAHSFKNMSMSDTVQQSTNDDANMKQFFDRASELVDVGGKMFSAQVRLLSKQMSTCSATFPTEVCENSTISHVMPDKEMFSKNLPSIQVCASNVCSAKMPE